MTTLDQVKQLRSQGMNDSQIAQQLKEQGINPLEVSQTIEQAKIKAAISPEQAAPPQQTKRTQQYAEQPTQGLTPDMQPSITEAQQPMPTNQGIQPQEQQQQAPSEQEYYQEGQEYYPEYQQYQTESGIDTSTEIAEQITDEKIAKLKKEIGNITTLRTTTERNFQNLSERLKRIEDIIDRLQATILGKIGSYGQSVSDIKKEMSLMQNSFSKALPNYIKPIVKKTPKVKTESKKPTSKTESGKKSKSKAGIEHYLAR